LTYFSCTVFPISMEWELLRTRKHLIISLSWSRRGLANCLACCLLNSICCLEYSGGNLGSLAGKVTPFYLYTPTDSFPLFW
jgi:hypothetical protein